MNFFFFLIDGCITVIFIPCPILNLLPAYTNELELEVAHLQEENAKLRRQQEKVILKLCFCSSYFKVGFFVALK